VADLTTATSSGLRVSLADKIHNARSMAADHRAVGDALWDRFNAGKEQQGMYYRSLCQAFQARLGSTPPVVGLCEIVDGLFPDSRATWAEPGAGRRHFLRGDMAWDPTAIQELVDALGQDVPATQTYYRLLNIETGATTDIFRERRDGTGVYVERFASRSTRVDQRDAEAREVSLQRGDRR